MHAVEHNAVVAVGGGACAAQPLATQRLCSSLKSHSRFDRPLLSDTLRSWQRTPCLCNCKVPVWHTRAKMLTQRFSVAAGKFDPSPVTSLESPSQPASQGQHEDVFSVPSRSAVHCLVERRTGDPHSLLHCWPVQHYWANVAVAAEGLVLRASQSACTHWSSHSSRAGPHGTSPCRWRILPTIGAGRRAAGVRLPLGLLPRQSAHHRTALAWTRL